ncbi:ribonuclease HII [Nitratifractor sp.]
MVNITKKIKNLLDFLPEETDCLELCGIDEAGRGPLAGPLVVAGVILSRQVNGLGDSKKLSPQRREILYERILQRSRYHLVVIGPDRIDGDGLSLCMKGALEEIMARLAGPEVVFLFDGNTRFGVSGLGTLVGADDAVPQVSAASILAKVHRDRIMEEAAKRYPGYGFEKHKGYGTVEHREAIRRLGLCPIHRRSFCEGILMTEEIPTLF